MEEQSNPKLENLCKNFPLQNNPHASNSQNRNPHIKLLNYSEEKSM